MAFRISGYPRVEVPRPDAYPLIRFDIRVAEAPFSLSVPPRPTHYLRLTTQTAASNLAPGWLADNAAAGAWNLAGHTVTLWFFFLLSLTALSSAVRLRRRETGPTCHRLEGARPVAATTV
jgi:hypothetical protein